MKGFEFIVLSLLLLGIITSVATKSTQTPTPNFSTRLFDEIRNSNANKNIIISPASIKSCLGLAYMGADGETANELHNNLQLKSKTKDEVGQEFGDYMQKVEKSGVEMKTANRIYVDDKYDVDDKFNELTQKYFKTKAEKVNFRAPETVGKINSWVAMQTNDKIKKAIDSSAFSSENDISAILVNAIYFKANWQHKFDESRTQDKDFRASKQSSKPVKMMHQTLRLQFADLPEMDASAIEIPYDKTDMRMLILLPNKIDGLPGVEEKLKQQDLKAINFYSSKINLQMPKFKIEFGISLTPTLKNLGIKQMFNGGNFNSLSPNGLLKKVSDVDHKAFIEVDEQGTEAAAYTGIVGAPAHPGPPDVPRDFIVDHPFFFAIKDSDTIYFAGHINEP